MATIGQLLSGALGGAGTGASIGSFIPGIGTGIGAGLGGLGGLLASGLIGNDSSGFFGVTPSQTTQLPRFSGGQQDLMNLILGQARQGLDFGPIEEQARQGFAQKTVPTLAERFNKLGMGQTALTSPSFGTALGGAAAGLERDLAALKSQRGLNLAQLGLTPQFENIYQPQQPSGLMSLLTGLAPGLGQAAGTYLGGLGQSSQLSNLLSQFGGRF